MKRMNRIFNIWLVWVGVAVGMFVVVPALAGDPWWGFDTLKRFLAGDHTWTGTQTYTGNQTISGTLTIGTNDRLCIDRNGDGVCGSGDIYVSGTTGYIPGPEIYWDNSGQWWTQNPVTGITEWGRDVKHTWLQDPVSGTTVIETIPGSSGVSAQLKGGGIYGMGTTTLYGSFFAGVSTFKIHQTRDGNLPGDMSRGGLNVVENSSGVTVMLYDLLADTTTLTSGTTLYQYQILDPKGSGVTIICPAGVTMYVADGTNGFAAGATLFTKGYPGAYAEIVPVSGSTLTQGGGSNVLGYYFVRSLHGTKWRFFEPAVGNTFATKAAQDSHESRLHGGTYIGD